MTSTIKVDTISENTSANGVSIDGLTIKDGGISATTGAIVFNEASADLDFRVESNGNANMLFVDGGNDKVGIGTSSLTGTLHVLSSNAGTTMYIEDSHAGDGDGPELYLYRNSASPADNDSIGIVKFLGRNDNSQDVIYGQMQSIILDASDGTEDAKTVFNNMVGGSSLNMLQFDNTGVIINESSNDLDFRVESNGNANMFVVDGGNDRVAIGTASPQTTLHVEGTAPIIRISDSNSTSEDDAVSKIEFYDRNNTDLNAEIVSGTGSLADFIISAHNNRAVLLKTNTAEGLRVTGSGQIGLNEDSVDVTQGGITMQQGGNDLNIMTFKSSDVAHGMTGNFETDTFAAFRKQSATLGGLAISSQSEGTESLKFNVSHSNGTTTKSSSGVGAVIVGVSEKSGTGVGGNGTNDNLLVITDYTSTRFIFDADGDFHADSSSTTFDTYEDAQLVRAYDLSHGKGVINSQFDKYIQYQHEDLADAGLVGREDDGTPNHFINVTGFQRLHNGAIWQQYEKHQRLAKAVYELAKVAVGEDKANEILEQNEIKLLN